MAQNGGSHSDSKEKQDVIQLNNMPGSTVVSVDDVPDSRVRLASGESKYLL